MVREGAGDHRPPSERHLQCVWLDPRLRPSALVTADAETVDIIDPGVWNLEAGPDFLDATVALGPHRRLLYGDVELHLRPGGWKDHGHHTDPRYDRVRIHVTFFPGRVPEGYLPAGTVEIALQKPLAANPYFSFDAVDLTAYPYSIRAPVPPCRTELQSWSLTERQAMLDAAGEERLRRKSLRLEEAVTNRGRDQALYEEVLCGLGYKHNKASFRLLAERVCHDDLRTLARDGCEDAYAILAGVSGLLPQDVKPSWDPSTRRFVRRVWKTWWSQRERWASRVMDSSAWRLAGLRPANHPLRRFMAAASLFAGEQPLAETISAISNQTPDSTVRPLLQVLTRPTHPYWDQRLSLGGRLQPSPVALLGATRAREVLVNAVVPWLAATGRAAPFQEGLLPQLPREGDNRIARQAAFYLFGPDHSPSLYRSGLRRQGLVQIFHDFCLADRSRCAACPFPSLLSHHRKALNVEDG